MPNEILNPDGSTTTLAPGVSPEAYIAEKVAAASRPAVLDDDGNEVVPAVVPGPDDVPVEVTPEELKVHPRHLPFARALRLGNLRAERDEKLAELDLEALKAWENGDDPALIKAQKQALRDLPPVAEAHLATLADTEAIAAYLPAELG